MAPKSSSSSSSSSSKSKSHGIPGFAIFLIVLIILLILAFVAWTVYSRMRARKLGLPPPPLNPFAKKSNASAYPYPSPAPGGVQGWINDKLRMFKNKRSARGAYESTSVGGAGGSARRGHGGLDPDEAWDTRVGNEADVYGPGGYYEEQELGLHQPAGYGNTAYEPERGRSRSRELDERYDEEMHGGAPRQNPFGEGAETSDMSLRGVSPRPMETSGMGHKSQHSLEDSPTERRSMFRENV